MKAVYTLRIEIPEDIEDWVHDEILDAKESHDDDEGALLRYLGDKIVSAEDCLNAELPYGFYSKIEGGKVIDGESEAE